MIGPIHLIDKRVEKYARFDGPRLTELITHTDSEAELTRRKKVLRAVAGGCVALAIGGIGAGVYDVERAKSESIAVTVGNGVGLAGEVVGAGIFIWQGAELLSFSRRAEYSEREATQLTATVEQPV
jgi:hypothetical protein